MTTTTTKSAWLTLLLAGVFEIGYALATTRTQHPVGAAIIAGTVAARRAVRVDPVEVLRG